MLNLLKSALLGATLLTLASSFSFAEPKHGIAMHGEPALPADFKNFPYVNPDAPKGGAISYEEHAHHRSRCHRHGLRQSGV
jgi:peptide/nickel transport system substrate-binding protein